MAFSDATLPDPRTSGPLQVFSRGLVLDGRYRLDRPLGEGGMGTLWVAQQVALQREVAIKSLRLVGGSLHGRLRQEALALAAVRHPSVVPVFDLGETPWGAPYIVMELIDGESLGAWLAREGAMEAREAVELVLPLLDGLAAAHAAGVIHRDLKPENVLLARTPDGLRPKLVDFGIAQHDRAEPGAAEDSTVMGTPAFMAPEQIRGYATDERTDVWGFGVLLYTMIAGGTPFLADDLMGLLRKVVDDPPPYPRQARGLDGRLWRILMDAMRKDPEERVPSARALRDELAWWLQGPSSRVLPGAEPVPRETTPPASPRPADLGFSPETENVITFDALIQRKLEGS